jgi:hypothetical protein
MQKEFQAKVISDEQIVLAVDKVVKLFEAGAKRDAVCSLFPSVPKKVVAAKLRQATLKGKLTGCASDVCARELACRPGCVEGFRVAAEA